LYTKGSGIPQDLNEAVGWYRKAAEQGFAPALHELGARYAAGRGVEQDYVAAHVCLDLAAFRARGPLCERYSAERDGVAGKLTPEQVAEAKRRALELKTKWAR
jgi:TPR repeat protein